MGTGETLFFPISSLLKYRYEGDWTGGLRQGKGKYTCKTSGGKYEGEYKGDKKEGEGRYDWSNGDWYEGSWKAGLRHGKGLYVWKEKNEKYDDTRLSLNSGPTISRTGMTGDALAQH